MRILLVDDDARMRQVLAKLLAEAGFQAVQEVGDAEEALSRLASEQFGLILSDFNLPGMDGIALVTALRARGDLTPIIMLSGQHDSQTIIRAVRAGVNNYIPKPIHPQVLFEKIWQTLGISPVIA